MGRTISLTEARAKLDELVRDARADNIVLVRHGQPAAVMVSPEHYEGLLEEIEDLKDRLSLHGSESSDPNVPLGTLRSAMGSRGV
jgi:antitoxin StbD